MTRPLVSQHYHTVFGRCIRSAIPLPELRVAAPGPFRWDFQVVDELPEPRGLEARGEEPIYAEVVARFFAHDHGYRIVVQDTGTFDLSQDGRRILWLPNPDPWWDFGRGHLLGRVLSTTLHLEGLLALHASAVELGDGVVGFMAPSHYGKSTLSMQLFQAGARFVTDDTLPVRPGYPPLAHPGVQSLRVRSGDPNASRLLGRDPVGEPGRDGKISLPPLPRHRTLHEPRPLAALYLLSPMKPGTVEEPVRRVRLDSVPAAIFLVGQAKIGEMLGSRAAPELLEATSAVASAVPIYRLELERDLDQLPAVVERIFEWHGLPQGGAHGAVVQPADADPTTSRANPLMSPGG